MKKLLCITVLAASLAAGQALAAQVTQIALSFENGAAVARVSTDGAFQFRHQTEIPKEGKGDRMILDLIGVVNGLSVKNFVGLPSCGITSIRTSQYAVTPEKVVRIVFDVSKAPVYQVEQQGNSVKITFTDKAISAFPSWTSGSVPKAAPEAPAPKPAPSVAKAPNPPGSSAAGSSDNKVVTVEKDRLASLSAGSNVSKSAPVATNTPTPPISAAKASDTKPAAQSPSTPGQSSVKVITADEATPSAPSIAPASTPVKVVSLDNPKQAASPNTTAVTPKPAVDAGKMSSPSALANKPEPSPAKQTVQQSPNATATVPPTPDATIEVSKPVVPSIAPATKPDEQAAKQTAPSVATEPATAQQPTQTPAAEPLKPVPMVVSPSAKPEVAAEKISTPPEATAMTAHGNQIQQALSAKPVSTPAATEPTVPAAKSSEKSPDENAAVAQAAAGQAKPATPTAFAPSPNTKSESTTTVSPASSEKPTTSTAALKEGQPSETKVTIPPALKGEEDAQLAEADNAESGNPDLPANKSTARFRRSPATDARIKGTMVAEFPQRLVVKYEAMGNRDPFATLIDDTKTYDTPIQNRIPNIDGLRLVGIIESDRGATDNRALFEDKNGYSYILTSGDKVLRGYVLRVERDRVYFQIFEYGWSRTVALAIENAN